MKLDSAKLVLPAALAVTTLVAFACKAGPDDEGSDDETTVAEGSDTGDTDCFAIMDMAACEADPVCNWDPENLCLPDCTVYTTQAECEATQVCAWDSVEGCLGPIV